MKRFMIVLCVVACFGSPVWGAIDVNFEGPLPSNVSLQAQRATRPRHCQLTTITRPVGPHPRYSPSPISIMTKPG